MRIITADQGTDDWLLARAGIATASCFKDVMAKIKTGEAATRRNYRIDLVVERLTGKPLPTPQSFAMKQGIEREPDARMAYMIRTGAVVDQVGLVRHDELECGASPDGLIGIDGGLEIKCPERSAHFEYLRQKAEPPEYTWQIQGGMWICERQWWDFVSYNPDFPEHLQLIVRRIKRDEKAIDSLKAEVTKFMQEVRKDEASVRDIRLAA